jgi:uncharacterized protein YndB with AHSA1/START domain
MAQNTVELHRVLRAPPQRIYRAFLDPDAMAKWLPPHGFTGRVHSIKAEVGGTYKMSFTNLTTASRCSAAIWRAWSRRSAPASRASRRATR